MSPPPPLLSLYTPSLSLSLLVSSFSSWLLWGGVGHLMFSQPRCCRGPWGPEALCGSCGSFSWAAFQLCPGFGFWHGPVPGKHKSFSFLRGKTNTKTETCHRGGEKMVTIGYKHYSNVNQVTVRQNMLLFLPWQGLVSHSPLYSIN